MTVHNKQILQWHAEANILPALLGNPRDHSIEVYGLAIILARLLLQ